MPMTEIVRYLNWRQGSESIPFGTANRSVYARYGGFQLESRFYRVVEVVSGRENGHSAQLHPIADAEKQVISSEAVFVLPTDDQEFIYLDRLVRTLHALNYLLLPNRDRLFLPIHQRHMLSVQANHGLAFEEILTACGLRTEQITLEVDIGHIRRSGNDDEHLLRAIGNYRSRGYQISIHRLGCEPVDYSLLRKIQPTLVRLDTGLLEKPEQLRSTIDELRALGIKSLASGLEPTPLRAIATLFGIDFIEQ
ncbi:MAG: hypothetical protein RIR18_689 [Pseudomonadota bacterium]|jgi:EAL domain-containing protein (putative c-di-GMP-specific phosphodiesterase class I)